MAEEKTKKNYTVFGEETEFDGTLSFRDNLAITGKFHGTIKATGDLEIDRTAVCNVDSIEANSIVISGTVKGNLTAPERIEMCSGSNVKGDVETSRLRIANNVDFEGQVSMIEGNPDVDIFKVASKEYKDALLIKTDEAH